MPVLVFPTGVAVDGSGNVYVADSQNHAIRKITTNGEVTTLAGWIEGFEDGETTDAKFSMPVNVAVDVSGNVYVADLGNKAIRKMTPLGGVDSTETFGIGSNQFTIDFKTIGNIRNAPDSSGYGSVDYSYRIGTYEISQKQVNAAIASGLSGFATLQSGRGDMPAADISWYEAATFVNWLNTSSGYEAAYQLSYSARNGYSINSWVRNPRARYFIPNENEWYKAAYGKSEGVGYYKYPTASDIKPSSVISGTNPNTAVFERDSPASVYQSGGRSSYGTMGQGGNVWEFLESLNSTDFAYFRGGSYDYAYHYMMPSGPGSIGKIFRERAWPWLPYCQPQPKTPLI